MFNVRHIFDFTKEPGNAKTSASVSAGGIHQALGIFIIRHKGDRENQRVRPSVRFFDLFGLKLVPCTLRPLSSHFRAFNDVLAKNRPRINV